MKNYDWQTEDGHAYLIKYPYQERGYLVYRANSQGRLQFLDGKTGGWTERYTDLGTDFEVALIIAKGWLGGPTPGCEDDSPELLAYDEIDQEVDLPQTGV